MQGIHHLGDTMTSALAWWVFVHPAIKQILCATDCVRLAAAIASYIAYEL